MSKLQDDRFHEGIRLCRQHMKLASLRGDYPGLAPMSLEEAVTKLPPEERRPFLTGYEKELKRYEDGVRDARSEVQRVWMRENDE